MDISQIIVLVIYSLSLLSMGVLVALLLSGARSTSKRFILFIGSLFIWLIPQFLAQFIFFSSPRIAHWLIRLSLLFAGFVVPSLTLFIKERLKNRRLRFMTILGAVSFSLGIFNFFPLSELNIAVSTSGIAVTSIQPFYFLLTTNVFVGFIVAFFAIRNYEKHQTDLASKQAFSTLRKSLGLTVGLNIFAAAFLAKYEWSQVFTPVSMALMTGIMYVAIFKHRLYDVRRLVARSLAYVGTVLALSVLYGWIAFGLVSKLIFKNNSISTAQEIVQVALVVAVAFTLQPLKRLFNKLSNRFFYRDAYDSSVFLADFNRFLVSTIDLKGLLVSTAQVTKSNLKAQYCAFFISGTLHSHQRVISDAKVSLPEDVAFRINEVLKKDHKKVVVTEKLATLDPLKPMLAQYDIAVIVSLRAKSDLGSNNIGFMSIGSKKSGNVYNSEDIALLQILANELTIATQNSLRFEEIQKFNETLQQKITDATKELRHTNEKLKALDEAKDEFISMASHQLRTPLTSVKGYVSMVLDGDAGKVGAQQKQLLEQAFTSSQRMVYLIADLLNVSRLKTGKFIIEPAPVNLPDVVEGEMQQLTQSAKAHNLVLSYEKPASFPVMNLDETKTRQVIMNFMDNAIYYTPAGGHIKVELTATDKTVEFKVIDDGLGVPKAEQPHLFTKFFRAGNAKKARPDGTGLGLFMAKKVIVAQGGALLFQSEEGKGSTFGFSFPRATLEVKK